MKTKRTTLFSLISACVIIAGTAVIFTTSANASGKNTEDNKTESAFTQNQADPDIYSVYKPFGLTIEEQTGKLYYDGKLVRCFDDVIPTKNFSTRTIGYYEEAGLVDVRAVRENADKSKELIGLEVSSDAEFQSRAVPGDTKRPSEKSTNMFEAYEAFGLNYDETKNALFYEGKRVRLFWDSLISDSKPEDSENLFSSNLSNWDAEGTIDLYAVRDYKHSDENGYEKLTGVRIASQEEYDENTRSFSKGSGGIEIAE